MFGGFAHKLKTTVKNSLLTILFAMFYFFNFAQEIVVLDSKTGKSIEGVLVVGKEFTTQTNKDGIASLKDIKETDYLVFQHSSYLKYKTTKKNIWSSGNKVFLVEDPVRLDEVVVSVSRREQSKAEIPNKIVTINAGEIQNQNPQTTADLLGSKGGIFIQKSQLGGGSPMIRGFSANRVLIVVDGIRMNNAIYRSGNLQNVISIDANSIEQTEIIFGPGSVIYGSDALGGVMSFNTTKPKLSTSALYNQSNQVFARYSTANKEKSMHGQFNFGVEKWAALVSLTYNNFGNLKMGSNGNDEYLRPEYVTYANPWNGDQIIQNEDPEIQKQSGYNQVNLLAKYRYRPNANFELNLGLHHSQTSDVPRYDRLIVYKGDELKYGDWYYGPQKWSLLSGEIRSKKETALCDNLGVLIGYQNYEESRHNRKLDNSTLSHRTEKLNIVSLNVDLDKELDEKNNLFYGVEGYYNFVNSEGTGEDISNASEWDIDTRYPDGSTYYNLAGYLIYKLNLNKKFTFQSGARYTYTAMEGEFSKEFFDLPVDNFSSHNSALTGNIGLVFHPDEGWQINMDISSGFRSPNIDDIAKVFDSAPGNVVVPNPNLKPEYTKNAEISIIRSLGGKTRIELNTFYTYLSDAMVRRDFTLNGQDSIIYEGELSKVEALVNVDWAKIYGGSFTFEYLFNQKIRTRHTLTKTYGEDSEGLPVRHVPPLFGNSHLTYQNRIFFVDLYVQYCGEISNEDLAMDEREKPYLYATDEDGNPYSPSWWTLNLKSTVNLGKNFLLSGGIENILDKRYRPYSSGIVSPGINFIAAIKAKF